VKYSLFDRLYMDLLNPHPYGAWRYIRQSPKKDNQINVASEPTVSGMKSTRAA